MNSAIGSKFDMHDWTLVSVTVDWESSTVVVETRSPNADIVKVSLHGVTLVSIPKREEWGPSVSINKVDGPIHQFGSVKLAIEMQSGDTIFLEGKSIDML